MFDGAWALDFINFTGSDFIAGVVNQPDNPCGVVTHQVAPLVLLSIQRHEELVLASRFSQAALQQ